MKKIYLINPPSPFLIDDRSNVPLGILYIYSFLQSKGKDVEFIDLAGKNEDEWSIPTDGDFYGISATTPQFEIVCKIAEIVKDSHNQAVLGGIHGSCLPEESLLTSKFDIVVRGEGEYTALDLVNDIDLSEVKGISYKQNNKIIHNESRPFAKNVDVFPHPKLECLDLSTYHCGVFTTSEGDNINGTQIITSRGCPHNCAFCSSPYIYRRKMRFHSAAYIRDWIHYLYDKGYNYYYVVDDSLILNKKRLKEICNVFREQQSLWRCCVRGDSVDKETLKMMYDSGCRQIDIGVESGSQKILDLVEKGEKVEDNANAIRIAKEIGLKVKACIMVGLPGEEEEDVDATISFINEYDPDSVTLCTFVPFPGCRIFQEPDRYGFEIDIDMSFDTYFCCGADTNITPLNISKEKTILFRNQLLEAIGRRSTRYTITKRQKKKAADAGIHE